MKAVSPIVAVLLLLIVTIAGALGVYMIVNNLWGGSSTESLGLGGSVLIDEIKLVEDEEKEDHYFAIDLYVRNNGGKPLILVPGSSVYILKDKSMVSQCFFPVYGDRDHYVLEPGNVLFLRCYCNNAFSSGKYVLKVVSKNGVSDSRTFSLEGLMGKSMLEKVYVGNSSSNPVVKEDEYAVYKAWGSPDGSNYRIDFQVQAKPGVTINILRAELFDSSGEHPGWVGSYSIYHWTTPYTYPDYAGAYWRPVAPSEMPVTIIYAIFTS